MFIGNNESREQSAGASNLIFLLISFHYKSQISNHQVNPPEDTLLSKLNSPDAKSGREYPLVNHLRIIHA